jgi:cytochrome c
MDGPQESTETCQPFVHHEATVDWGKQVYHNNCAYCHGEALEGLTAEDAGPAKDVPNLKRSLKTHTEGDIFLENPIGQE